MKNRISYILVLSMTTAMMMPTFVSAKSQFLPEAKENFSDFSNADSTLYSPIILCREDGYTITSCPEGSLPSKPCPYGISTGLYKECVPAASVCVNKGYTLNCEEGYEADYAQRCPEDNLYTKCKCNTCVGYYYSEEEANAEGYIADGDPCLSCNEKKYKRIENPCDGFEYDSTNCGISSCGTLEGETCRSGAVLKYKECAPCPTPACPDGTVNYDTYFCDGALRCYWPDKEPSCTQTMCFDYTYSESVTCKSGYVKKSCTDPCVGTRYKCEEKICTPTKDCSGYNLISQTGCSSGYESCDDGCGKVTYKCKNCTPTQDCSSYPLTAQIGCYNGYLSCYDGCGATKYKCKPYAVGDEYIVGGASIGRVIEVNGTSVIVASAPKVSSAEINDYCIGTWTAPNKNKGKLIVNVYKGSYDSFRGYLRINDYSFYCVSSDGGTWSKGTCTSSYHTLYNSCIITMQQI